MSDLVERSLRLDEWAASYTKRPGSAKESSEPTPSSHIDGTQSEGTPLPKVPFNKLGHYFEDDDTNAVIPISYHNKKAMAILDGGAGVILITRQC